MTFNIFQNAVIRNDSSCRHDNRDGWHVAWDTQGDFKGYTEHSGVTTRIVWDKRYAFATTSGTCYVGPSEDQSPFDGGVYSTVKVTYRIEKANNGTKTPTKGRIQFQTDDDPTYDSVKTVDFPVKADNAYNEYIIDMSQKKEWAGNITRLRLHPFVDGDAGYLIHLKSIKVQSPSVFNCDTRFDGPVCDKYSEYHHPCPWVGRGGSISSESALDYVTIEEDVNDYLSVDINGYGSQGVRLDPVVSGSVDRIARDIERKLSNIAIGGYAGCRVDVDMGKLTLVADDTRESSSVVVVEDTPAARTLGFFNHLGQTTSTLLPGEDSASRYEPAGNLQLSKSEIDVLYKGDFKNTAGALEMDTSRYTVRGGRSDFSFVFKEQKLNFQEKTVIDFNNPITNTGRLTYFGYSGDGTTETEILLFRPKADGSLTLVHAKGLGIGVIQNDKVFEVDIDWKVRKGDLLGIYDGKLDLGLKEEFPNSSYYTYDGKLGVGDKIDGPLQAKGRGDRGLRIFAHGREQESEAVLDISFDSPTPVEFINITAEEEAKEEELNLTRARSGGLEGGIHLTGETGKDKFGVQAPPLTNLEALIDGVSLNKPDAEYMYPSWLDTNFFPADKYDQTEFNVVLDFAKGAPVFFNISRVNIYFRDINNIKYFSIEYPVTTNDADTLRNWGPVSSRFNKVLLEGDLLEPDSHPLYSNPFVPTVGDYVDSYQVLEYYTLGIEFEPVRARSLRYYVKNYGYEDDVTKATLSNFELAPSPRVLEFEVFAKSTPVRSIADNFEIESSLDGVNYVAHSVVQNEGETSASYLVGYPVTDIKLRIRPQGKLGVSGLGASTSRSKTKVLTNSFTGDVSLNISTGDFSSTEVVVVNNNNDSTYNYFVDIGSKKDSFKECILWNRLDSIESLQESEIGPSAYVWRREGFSLRASNYGFKSPGYVADPFWLTNKRACSYISYNEGSEWVPLGSTLTDYNSSSYITSENTENDPALFTYILVDLGDVYSIETIQAIRPAGFSAFSGPLYSALDVSDPSQLDLVEDFEGVKEEARWLRFRAFSREVGAEDRAALSYVRISLDVLDRRNKGKIRWLETDKLTNFRTADISTNHCGEGWHCPQDGFTNWYAIDLRERYDIYNIIAGPPSSNMNIGDYDTVTPGGSGSMYSSSSAANPNVAYSPSMTDNISKVQWSPRGNAPSGKDRWILVRAPSGIKDEFIVYVEGNDATKKESLGSASWWSSTFGEVVRDYGEYVTPYYSISNNYPANHGPKLNVMEISQSLGIDHILAKRDQLKVTFYVSDVSQLDFSQGYLSIGRNTNENNSGVRPLDGAEKDEENYFLWPLSDLEPFVSSGWNEVYLPFTDNYRVGRPSFEEDDLENISSDDISGRSRFRWFRVAYVCIPGNTEVELKVDDLSISRADFTPGKFGNAIYLPGEEYVRFPLHNFNIYEGTIEFYLNPEWAKDPGCFNCSDARDHTIFRIFNNDGYSLGCIMTGSGLRVYLSDGNTQTYFLTDNSPVSIVPGRDTHVALTWDLRGVRSRDAFRVFINNTVSAVFEQEALDLSKFVPNPSANLVLGGNAWDGVSGRRIGAVEGTIENLKVFNFAKDDFRPSMQDPGLEYYSSPEELIEISADGVNFYGVYDRGKGFPLLYRNVASGDSFKIYIRNRERFSRRIDSFQSRDIYFNLLGIPA